VFAGREVNDEEESSGVRKERRNKRRSAEVLENA